MLRHQWWCSTMVTGRIWFSACTEDGGGGTKKLPPLKLTWWYPWPQVIVVMLGGNMEVTLCYLDCIWFSFCNNLWVWPCMLHSTLLSLAAAWRHIYYGHALFCLMLFGAACMYFFSWVMCIEATFQLSEWVQVTYLSSFLSNLVFFYLCWFLFVYFLFFSSSFSFSPVIAKGRQGGESSQWWKILFLNILIFSGAFFNIISLLHEVLLTCRDSDTDADVSTSVVLGDVW